MAPEPIRRIRTSPLGIRISQQPRRIAYDALHIARRNIIQKNTPVLTARSAHYQIPDGQRACAHRNATSRIDSIRPNAAIISAIFKLRGQSNSRRARALSRMPRNTHGARRRKTSCRAYPLRRSVSATHESRGRRPIRHALPLGRRPSLLNSKIEKLEKFDKNAKSHYLETLGKRVLRFQVSKFSNFRFPNFPISNFPNFPIFKFSNFQISKFSNFQMFGFSKPPPPVLFRVSKTCPVSPHRPRQRNISPVSESV